ncbi:hypothetical protein LCGC14_1493550, partial [marine sediment metagenome]
MKKYSEKEIQFLKNNYANRGAKYCAEKLNRGLRSIRSKANRLKFKVLPGAAFNNKIWTYNANGVKMKTCPNCNTSKILECFGKDKSRYDELNVYCKICVVALSKISRQNNIKAVLKWEAEYRANNKELIKKQQTDYKKNHPDKLKATKRKWKMANRHKSREYKRKRRALKYSLNETYTTKQEQLT